MNSGAWSSSLCGGFSSWKRETRVHLEGLGEGGFRFSKAVVLNHVHGLSMGKQKHPEVGFTNHSKVVVVVVVVMGIRKIDA